MPSNTVKPSAGRVIRIINSNDHTVQVNQYGKIVSQNTTWHTFRWPFPATKSHNNAKKYWVLLEKWTERWPTTSHICRQICVCVYKWRQSVQRRFTHASLQTFPLFHVFLLLFAKKSCICVPNRGANNNKNDTLTHNPIVYFAKCSRSKRNECAMYNIDVKIRNYFNFNEWRKMYT